MITAAQYAALGVRDRRALSLAAKFSAETLRYEGVGYHEPTDTAFDAVFTHRFVDRSDYPLIRRWFLSEFTPSADNT